MKKFIYLITILIALASCRSPQQIADRKCDKAQLKYEKAAYRWGCPMVQQSDTVFQQMIIRETHDTTIFVRIAADTVFAIDTVTIKDGIASSDKSRLDTQYAFSIAYVHDSKLYHNLFQKESEIASTIKDAIQNNSKVEYKYITNTVTKTTNVITHWQWVQIWMGRILMVMLLIVIVFTVIKLYLKK
jgi:hypothetical protein